MRCTQLYQRSSVLTSVSTPNVNQLCREDLVVLGKCYNIKLCLFCCLLRKDRKKMRKSVTEIKEKLFKSNTRKK